MVELQRTTAIKTQKSGYTLVEVYQCELSKNSDFKKWCKNNTIDIATPLNPRDAFFGG